METEKQSNKFVTILGMITVIIISVLIAGTMLSVFSGCTTQASIVDNEPYACYCSRYLAREKQNSDTMTKECANSLKRDWCVKMLKEQPELFKDFNDCWRQ